MEETIKEFAQLELREEKRNVIILKVDAHCSDGRKREAINYIEDKELIEDLMLDVSFNDLGKWKPTNIPDDLTIQALSIKELYFIDSEGIYFDILEKEEEYNDI